MSKPPNPQRRSEQSHRAILEAALDLCGELGFGNVTVEAIAARAGTSKKTIYRWWPSKGAVVLEAIVDIVESRTAFPSTGDLTRDLLAQIAAVLGFLNDQRAGSAYRGLIAATQSDAGLAKDLVEQLIEPRVAAATERLAEARRQGELDPDADLRLTVELLYGPVYYRLLLHLGPQTPGELRALIDRVIEPIRR